MNFWDSAVEKLQNENDGTKMLNITSELNTKLRIADSTYLNDFLSKATHSLTRQFNIIEHLKIDTFFDMDQLYEDICTVKEVVKAAVQNEDLTPLRE